MIRASMARRARLARRQQCPSDAGARRSGSAGRSGVDGAQGRLARLGARHKVSGYGWRDRTAGPVDTEQWRSGPQGTRRHGTQGPIAYRAAGSTGVELLTRDRRAGGRDYWSTGAMARRPTSPQGPTGARRDGQRSSGSRWLSRAWHVTAASSRRPRSDTANCCRKVLPAAARSDFQRSESKDRDHPSTRAARRHGRCGCCELSVGSCVTARATPTRCVRITQFSGVWSIRSAVRELRRPSLVGRPFVFVKRDRPACSPTLTILKLR